MSNSIPAHRSGFTARSGDTHVIGEDGVAVNADRQARDAAATPAASAPRKPRKSDSEA